MSKFEGDREFALGPDETYARLTDVSFLVGCIPDVETVRVIEAASGRTVASIPAGHTALAPVLSPDGATPCRVRAPGPAWRASRVAAG